MGDHVSKSSWVTAAFPVQYGYQSIKARMTTEGEGRPLHHSLRIDVSKGRPTDHRVPDAGSHDGPRGRGHAGHRNCTGRSEPGSAPVLPTRLHMAGTVNGRPAGEQAARQYTAGKSSTDAVVGDGRCARGPGAVPVQDTRICV